MIGCFWPSVTACLAVHRPGKTGALATQCGSSPFARNNSRNVVNNPLTGLKKLLTLSEISWVGRLFWQTENGGSLNGGTQKSAARRVFDVYANVNILYVA